MVVGRALRATGCATCRLSLLRSFTAIAGLHPRTLQLTTRLPSPIYTPRARFTSSKTQDGGKSHAHELQEAKVNDDELEEDLEENNGESSEVSAAPWYLQVDAPQREPQPLSERQRIPDLPESPPPILEPLLQQISIDLGLDNLSLLDLRKLDPPPALGANLLMVIGTARSEKHLHVSADRLCRWLRSTYKLRPDADGLLGRNELKLKLRRKSRRAKLLGSANDDNADDGVRTGWVCVDVGVVEGADNVEDSLIEPHGFIGFGRRTDGVRIVVQMLTEEKRMEIDLERLWGGILKRGTQPEIEDLEEDVDASSSALAEHATIGGPIRKLGNGSSILAQSRGFHTSSRHFLVETQSGSVDSASRSQSAAAFSSSKQPDLKETQESVMIAIASGDFEKARESLLKHSRDIPQLQNNKWGQFLLLQLKMYLESTSKDRALLALGRGRHDHYSTPFLKCFHQTLSTFPSKFEVEMKIWLYCFARKLGHHGYGFNGLMDLFNEVQQSGMEVSTDSYLQLLRSALRPMQIEGEYHGPPRHFAEGAMKILQSMYDQGHNILTEDVFVTLQEAAMPLTLPEFGSGSISGNTNDTFDLPTLPMSPIQRRIHVLMKAIDMPTFQPETRLRLLDLYSRHHHWGAFWAIWRLALRQGEPQTAPLYAFMFSRIAETQHQKACINVLRTWIPDLGQEIPAVELEGDVAEAVKACLRVADPYVEQDVTSDPDSKGEWVALWRRCSNGSEI